MGRGGAGRGDAPGVNRTLDGQLDQAAVRVVEATDLSFLLRLVPPFLL